MRGGAKQCPGGRAIKGRTHTAAARAFSVAAIVLTLAGTGFASATPATRASSDPSETGRVVVGVSDGLSSKQLEQTVKRSGASVVLVMDDANVAVVDPRPAFSAEDIVRELQDKAGVRYAQPERRVKALFTPDDTSYALQWGLVRTGLPLAWNVQRGAASVSVAVVDSGVESTHPDLVGQVDASRGFDFIEGDTDATDGLGHGTHVAGTIAAQLDNGLGIAGIASGCTIIAVRVLDATGSGTDLGVAQGIRWAADQGADVINLSLGTTDQSTVIEEACSYAIARDCLIVAASGNAAAQTGWITGQIQYPAAHEPVVAVGAIDQSGQRASFSEWGSALDLVAPGVDIHSLFPVDRGGAAKISGTSMAAAHVSGVAALLRSQHPEWTATETIARLEESAEDVGAPGWDAQTGAGLVRADLAVGATSEAPGARGDDPADGVVETPAHATEADGRATGADAQEEAGSRSGRVTALGTPGGYRAGKSGAVANRGPIVAKAADTVAGVAAGGASPTDAEEPAQRGMTVPFGLTLLAVVGFAVLGVWRAVASAGRDA